MADSVPFWLYRPSAARAHAMELLSQLRAASGHRHRGHIQRAAALGPPFGDAWRRLLPMLPQHLWRIWRFARLPRSFLAVAWRSNISIGGISDDLCDCERELTIRTMSPPLPPPTLPSPLSVRSAVTRRLLSFFPSVLCGFPAVLMSRGGRADGGRQIEI